MSATPVPPSSPVSRAVPTAPGERQPALDVLRGAALLGILLVNVQLMAGPELIESLFGLGDATATMLERVLGGLIGWLVAGKFISSFSILFGVGAAVIAGRALARGRAPRRLLARRYLLLMCAGLAHMVLLFPGDVLFLYGVTGLVLLAFLNVRDRTLRRWIVGLIVASVVVIVALTVAEAGTEADAATVDLVAAALADAEVAYASGSYLGVVVWQAQQSLFIQSSALVTFPWTLALFLIGMLAQRHGLALDPAGNRASLVRIVRVALPVGLVLNLPLLLTGPVAETAGAADVGLAVLVGAGIANALGAPVLAVGYLAALAVLVVDRGAERGIRRRLAALGRIALTGYLLQSILALVVFFGFGAYGRTALLGEPILGMLAFTLGVWVVLLAFAPWWTARFRSGPFEWLWRWGTYGVRP
jgi:uncharacterized protein